MLVLTRKLREQIVIGRSVTVTVLEIRSDRIRLGFEGPREVPILRGEVAQRMAEEEAAAAGGAANSESRFHVEFA